jgi:5-(carboxyamino)imidazole ribonucleotide mutase
MGKQAQVIIVMGSRSDLPVMEDAQVLLEGWGVKTEVEIVSAHRTPELLEKSAIDWEKDGIKVIIAGAGGAAHLPGMLASYSILPVIGVPIKGKAMNGLDSLLSIAQMPKGVPVATVAVDNAFNAALLAAEILALLEPGQAGLRKKLKDHKKGMATIVRGDRKKLGRLGVAAFLRSK